MLKHLLAFIFFLFAFHQASAQNSCLSTGVNGTVINLPCGVNCAPMNFKVPHLKSTSAYTLTSIPYNPLPYVTSSGIEDQSLYDDDRYSDKITLPFTFCFYDSLFSNAVVGSNGLITFDTTNASCANAYTITPAIPSGGTTQCTQLGIYYPRAAIMVNYSDLDPRPGPSFPTVSSPADRKIEWRVEGSAPCRRFVVSYFHIGVFQATTCGLTSPATFQMVIYESTGLIEFFYENNSCQSQTNQGKGIMGIQNWNRNQAGFHPNRNAVVWSASNEGWRFTPSGGSSRFVKAELWDINGVLISTTGITTGADTLTTIPGVLDINFPQQCLNAASAQYIIRTYYASCSDPLSQIVSNDTITVNKSPGIGINMITGNANCGGNNGTISVTANGGIAPYQYSINGTTFQPSNIFNVSQGNYTVTIKDSSGCTKSDSTIIGFTNNLVLTPIKETSICEGFSVQLQSVTNATQFVWTPATSLNNPNIQQPTASPTTTMQYILTATLGLCSIKDTVTVNVSPAPIADAGSNGTICFGATYQLQGSGGVSYQWTPATNLSSSSISNPLASPTQTTQYSLNVTDANGCVSLQPDIVNIDVTPANILQVTKDTIVALGDIVQLNTSAIAVSYLWSPATGLNDATIPNPVATISGEITYSLIATTALGCKGQASVTLKVYDGPEIYVPTGFTPDGDGKNDVFKPFPVGIKKYNYFRVFNRWGQLIFQTTEFNKGWDGKLNGKLQPTGTYVWMIEGISKKDTKITKRGTVTLIK
jgi:gliding motility-associated-like protein